jgi:putative transposase
MSYWRLFYHLVWATQDRTPLIAAELEAPLFRIMVDRGNRLGAITFTVNGLPDHVHLVAAIPPTIALSEYVRQIKGASSHYAHTELKIQFAWQRGYGIFSVSERNLSKAVAYVEQQKVRHRAGTTLARLEETAEGNYGPELISSWPKPSR